MLEYGECRGDINSKNELKVHFKNESFWIKVVATNKEKTKVIGILMNTLLDTDAYFWGSMIIAEEINPNQLFEVKEIVNKIPNTEEWLIL